MARPAQAICSVGAGAGFAGDRIDPALDLVRSGLIDTIALECLAERTLVPAIKARVDNPQAGFDPRWKRRLSPLLPLAAQQGCRVVSNLGAANPRAAAHAISGLCRELGLGQQRVAALVGDDVMGLQDHIQWTKAWQGQLIGAHAYLGSDQIATALQQGAQVVVTGRVADSALFAAPARLQLMDQNDALAGALAVGHLLECGAQVSGGYFADPGMKDVPGLDNVGFPIAEIEADGSCVISKAEGTGGLVDERTVKEQLLYEVHDPAAYITPDVVADISAAVVKAVGPDRVRLSGVRGHPRTATLKANVFFDGGWLGEGEISYAGPNAEARARLAMDVLQKRMGALLALRFDLIGVSSILGDDANRQLTKTPSRQAQDVRLRVAGRHEDVTVVDRLLRELTALWTGGPAGGGGVRVAKRQRLSMQSCLIAREQVPACFDFVQGAH